MAGVNREYKDRVFMFIFGNPENRKWTLDLYNAVNGTDYANPDEIEYNTIENAVYMGMKNDVSFIVMSEMNLWEHQSSFNPNMPMRFFIYSGRLYEKYIELSEYNPYSSSLQKAPRPVCICFYNGTAEQPEKQVLTLSDAFGAVADIEVRVTMLNINYGKNRQLMESCRPLREYAWLVEKVRMYQKQKQNLEAAVDAAINEMPDNFEIKAFLIVNRAEVRSMFLTEYNQEKVLKKVRDEERKEVVTQERERTATDMLKDGEPLEKIRKYSRLSEASIRQLAEKVGAAVV